MILHGLPWWNWLLQGVGVVLAYVGAELNSRLDIRGFKVWIAANIALFILHVISGLAILAALDVIYIRLNVRSIQRWVAERKLTAAGSH